MSSASAPAPAACSVSATVSAWLWDPVAATTGTRPAAVPRRRGGRGGALGPGGGHARPAPRRRLDRDTNEQVPLVDGERARLRGRPVHRDAVGPAGDLALDERGVRVDVDRAVA